MSKSSKKHHTSNEEGGFVYSSRSGHSLGDLLSKLNLEVDDDDIPADSSAQTLEIHFEKKGRNGKTATIIRGFSGSDSALEELAKMLKSKCSVGGSAKDSEIILQGDVRNRVADILTKEGYKTKRVGG